MRTIVQKISQVIYKQFKSLWILFTIFILIVCLYINWDWSISRSTKAIDTVARSLSNNVDGLIEDLFQDVYTLPIYGNTISDCKTGLFSYLQHITLNNPRISGLLISDNNHKVICSNLPDSKLFISGTAHARTILGPIKLSLFDQPVYLIQQKMGRFHIGIIVLSSIFQNVLQPSANVTDSVSLYNRLDKKNIVLIEKSMDKSGWVFSENPEKISINNSQSLFAVEKLQSVDGIAVAVFENHNTVLANLWYSQILVAIVVLICSSFFYFLLKITLTKRYSLRNAMTLAIKRNEFYPVYQPLFDNEPGLFSGVEVLLRWQDNQDEIIMPDFFIEEAESTGLIVPITLQIIEIAFQELKLILSTYPQFHLSFNLSALHFTDAQFFNKFNLLMDQYKILPSQILFEITERDLLDKNNILFIDKMKELRQSGFSLAVDDYGTGHASISYLQSFPFNYLKIDKLFIQAIGTKAITESLNDAIITMAKQLGLIIIAEGVETEEQVNYLTTNGVRYLQGWYFSKALSIRKLRVFLEGNNNDSL